MSQSTSDMLGSWRISTARVLSSRDGICSLSCLRARSFEIASTFAIRVASASSLKSIDDGSVRVPVAERRGTIADAVRRLDDAGIPIDDISVRTPTLEDVFLNLTGRAAEAEAEEAEVKAR